MTMYMKKNIVLILCSLLLVTSCKDGNTPIADEPSNKVSVRAQAPAMRAAANASNPAQTVFLPGDKIGLFAVRNGAVMASVNNLCLTRTENGLWQSDTDIFYADSTREAAFYAYFPYDAAVSFDPASSEPFAAYIQAFQPAADQSAESAFHTSDLMTSAAGQLTPQATLDIVLQHRMALVCVELPSIRYVFSNEGLAPYVQWTASSVAFQTDATNIKAFYDAAELSYRFITKPASVSQLDITYTNRSSETKHASITNISAIPAGQFAYYTVDNGKTDINTMLHIGDFFLKDGSIIAKGTTPNATDVLGIVCQIGTTDSIAASNPSCTHALVLALDETKAKWSTKGSTTSDENNAGWKTWWTVFGLADLGTTKADEIDQATLASVGFEYTRAWLSVPIDLTIGGYIVPVKDGFQAYYDAYVAAHPLPNTTTIWFVPSLREWLSIKASESDIATSLTQVSAAPFAWTSGSTVYYWSSNLRASTSMWTFTGKDSSSSADLFHADTKDSRIYRLIFAF